MYYIGDITSLHDVTLNGSDGYHSESYPDSIAALFFRRVLEFPFIVSLSNVYIWSLLVFLLYIHHISSHLLNTL